MKPNLDPSVMETVAVPNPATPASGSSIAYESSAAADEGRFIPGTLLGGRYRILGLLGRGGMGEVYRATDLALGQSVALKFLPEEASHNPRLLERFHGEVRVARQVSHPNVCRVYDIGEADGMPFISMEYVDGEDLASLLLRIGRLPADKAVETARKLCAGLAAAHDKGVIHRDLKPQNIMLNKRGEVLIMDFGLAAIAGQLSGAEIRNGTPAYMAPEQLKGSEVTAKSDIYALGLVLYELFTGKRPYDAKSLQELIDLQESRQLSSMTTIAADIDPAVEKVIRRCLDPDPARRPATPLAVAAALPGGDALAAALAAGETPSPELVAAAGTNEGLARRYSIPCLIAVAGCLFGVTALRQHITALMIAPLYDTPEVLGHKAREIARSFGYPAKPGDWVLWLDRRSSLFDYMKKLPGPRKWGEWFARESPMAAEYRESADPLVAEPYGHVTKDNPPSNGPGMRSTRVSGSGLLLEFQSTPLGGPTKGGGPLAPPVAAETVFLAAGLDMATFTPVAPTLAPANASDEIKAWKGHHPTFPKMDLTVEIAWWKGRIAQVAVNYPWSSAGDGGGGGGGGGADKAWLTKARDIFVQVVTAVVVIFMVLLARRNWKRGRSDRKGALRVATAQILLLFVAWSGDVHPVDDSRMLGLFFSNFATWLLAGGVVWLLYMALEPAVRSRWPHSIVTWNRVLAGGWMDAQVGGHVLIGAAAGCVMWIAAETSGLLADPANPVNSMGSLFGLAGTRQWIGGHAGTLNGALQTGLIFFFVIFCLRVVVRKDVLAALVAASLFALTNSGIYASPHWQLELAVYGGLLTALMFCLLRFGLVTTMASIFFINSCNNITVGGNWRTWYAPYGIATLGLLLGIAVFAFWRSLGERELLGGEAAEVRSASFAD
ncbi:MAG TPA: serine/threonine-protein kinase [Candidatus Acidoferrales bacterium]|jgi:predicted Ser/Thr protein kinase|nr:serine/threonine-protein kinase [Candidatus Acidoferrales bacterium]